MLKTFLLLKSTLWSITGSTASEIDSVPLSAQEALKRLLVGNERYVKELLIHPNRSQKRREATCQAQTPFAAIIGCSDSRVSPVIIFDQGIGDLFEIRVAGNVVGPIEIASVQFAANNLQPSLIFVLGHANCGAVQAVLADQTKDIEPIAVKIQEAIKGLSKSSKNDVEGAVKANVNAVVEQLRENEAIAQLIKEKKLHVAGGYYHLDTGKVELCCDLPPLKI